MPSFFDPTQLTPEQEARYERAKAVYSRIVPEGMEFVYNRPGHPKSALFFRLLEGKNPLPFRPPTNHSYPWYELIESNGLHLLPGLRVDLHNGDRVIGIAQEAWQIVGANDAAESMLPLLRQQQLGRGPQHSDSGRGYLEATVARGPRFTVRHSRWPAFVVEPVRQRTMATERVVGNPDVVLTPCDLRTRPEVLGVIQDAEKPGDRIVEVEWDCWTISKATPDAWGPELFEIPADWRME